MRKIKLITVVIFSLFFALILVGCTNPNPKVKEYKLRFELEDGTVYKEYNINENEDIEFSTPSKTGHTFDGWYLNGQKVTSAKAEADTTFIGKFTINQYTYKFVVFGEVVKEVTAPYGSTIEIIEDPIVATTNGVEYEFIGWENIKTQLLQDEVFTALFNEVKQEFTYKFVDELGNVIKSTTAFYGTEIEYPENLEKEDTDEFDYEFIGWDHDDKVLTDNVVFTPVFSATKKQYTYKFLNEDGTVLKEETVDYGTMPIEPTEVTKEPINGQEYKFNGWDKEIVKVTGDVVYTATFIEYEFKLDGLKLSIFGDSISTFYAQGSEMNSYYSGTNQFYYPLYSSTIKTVDKTWWYQLLKNTKMELGINNSWSGSCAYGTSSSAGVHDGRINTVNENGATDIVIIYLGTNDLATGYTAEQFGSAIETMISKIRAKGVQDIFLFTLGYTNYTGNKYSEDMRLEYNEEIKSIAEEFECGIIPLDEYVINDNYMIYLGDFLHYNAKGAQLISKISEKAIKEYYGLPFDEEIEVEHKELLPEGVAGKITATAKDGFWTYYQSEVFFAPADGYVNPTFSERYQISKNSDGTYYVSAIARDGESCTYNCEYVLVISSAHSSYTELKGDLSNVKVGCVVEFNNDGTYPMEIIFKDPIEGSEPVQPEPTPDDRVEGQLHVGAYNDGVWTLYETTVMAYSQDKIDKTSTFINFNVIKLAKDGDNYKVTGLKPVGESLEFSSCDYYILIFSTLSEVSYYENAQIGDVVTIHGDITAGNANLEFK